MKKLTEFYGEQQGRPASGITLQAQKRHPSIPEGSIHGVMLAGEFSQTGKTDDYTASTEMVILVDATATNVKINLPAASTHPSKVYWIKKTDSSGHSVTIDGNDAETIDGELTIALTLQYQYIMIICDGTEWHILGGEYVKMEEILKAQETLLERLAKQLKAILRCLASMSGLNIDEED